MFKKFKSKSVELEAYQYTGAPDSPGVDPKTETKPFNSVTTIQGQTILIEPGEWVAKEHDGIHFYPIADDTFKRRWQPVDQVPVNEGVIILIQALSDDADYRRGWKDNIAMAFKDQYREFDRHFNLIRPSEIHEIATAAADRFLDQLCLPVNETESKTVKISGGRTVNVWPEDKKRK